MKKIRIIFFGSSPHSLSVLNALIQHKDYLLVGIVSQPDRPVGRMQVLTSTPVSQFARQETIPLFTPESQKEKYWLYQDSKKLTKQLAKLKPDLLISAYYGQKIPQQIINLTSFGGLNLHPSLLPQYRGSAPAQWVIFNGEKVTGITILKIHENFDQGQIIAQEKIKIKPTDTSETLYKELFERGAKLLIKTLPDYIRGKIKLEKQNSSQASYYPRLTRDNGKIDWSKSPEEIERMIRAFTPWPGTWTKIKLKTRFSSEARKLAPQSRAPNSKLKTLRLKILKAHLEKEKIILDQVQLEGKKPVAFAEFKRGYPNFQLL